MLCLVLLMTPLGRDNVEQTVSDTMSTPNTSYTSLDICLHEITLRSLDIGGLRSSRLTACKGLEPRGTDLGNIRPLIGQMTPPSANEKGEQRRHMCKFGGFV